MNAINMAASWIEERRADARDVWVNGGRPVRHNELGDGPRKRAAVRLFNGPRELRRFAERVRSYAHRHDSRAAFWLASALEMEAAAWRAVERGFPDEYHRCRVEADVMMERSMES